MGTQMLWCAIQLGSASIPRKYIMKSLSKWTNETMKVPRTSQKPWVINKINRSWNHSNVHRNYSICTEQSRQHPQKKDSGWLHVFHRISSPLMPTGLLIIWLISLFAIQLEVYYFSGYFHCFHALCHCPWCPGPEKSKQNPYVSVASSSRTDTCHFPILFSRNKSNGG